MKNAYNASAFVRGEFGNLNSTRYAQVGYSSLGPTGASIQTSLNNNSKNTDDGYWVTIQSWSSCTVACGGGT